MNTMFKNNFIDVHVLWYGKFLGAFCQNFTIYAISIPKIFHHGHNFLACDMIHRPLKAKFKVKRYYNIYS